jgi:hypothetical protein
MIEVVGRKPETVTMRVTVRRLPVYLDNWAIVALAKDQSKLREGFLRAVENGADLLFSVTNASEIVGPAGASQEAVRAFLAAIGPHWIPVEGPGIVEVIEREALGEGRESCIAHDLLQQFFAGRNIQLHGEQRLDFVGPESFNLSFFLDWLVPQRDHIRQTLIRFDAVLREKLRELRRAYEHNRSAFNVVLPKPFYNGSAPATFCWNGLIRLVILEGKAYQWKHGESADFCHALSAAAYAQFATLDKHWKRRVGLLPKPNSLASIYYEPELDRFVGDLEAAAAVSASPQIRHPLAAKATAPEH